jgi:hypothetical protein
MPFSTCQTRGSTCARIPTLATFRPQGFHPLDGFLPASPPDRLSGRSAPGLLPSRGLLLPVRRYSFRSPSPPRRWPPAASATFGGLGRTIGSTTREPVLEASRPGNPYRSTGCYPDRNGRIPSWAFSSLRSSLHRPRRPDPAAIPPGAFGRHSGFRPAAAPSLRGVRRPAAWLDSWSRATSPRFFPFVKEPTLSADAPASLEPSSEASLGDLSERGHWSADL